MMEENPKFGFYFNPENARKISEKEWNKIAENTWKIMEKYPSLSLELSGNNPGKMPEKSQENVGKNPDKFPEKPGIISEKVLEKVEKMYVKKPENSANYDTDYLEYCCKTLRHLVVGDGGSIKLTPDGLILKSNPGNPIFRLKYCPNCGAEIIQPSVDNPEKSVPEPKELLRDNMKNKPPA